MLENQPQKTSVSASTSPISSENLFVLIRETTTAARGLVRRLALPSHEHEDLRQELLLDLIARFKRFDPGRGTAGMFAGVIVRHRAKRLASRVNRRRAMFVPISLESWSREPNGANVRVGEGDCCTEALNQSHDGSAVLDQRLDLTRALSRLRPGELSLCIKLIDRTPTEISRTGEFSRAGLYRRLRNIRLRLLEEGVSWP
jgi:RNA polymerase sigma-70 factor (ECF subfamily)